MERLTVIGMKNANSMYALAKASAIEQGPRIAAGQYGYALSMAELTRIYAQNGFNIRTRQGRPPAMENHLGIWEAAGKAHVVGQLIFFELSPDEQRSASQEIVAQYRANLVPGATE